MLFERRLKQSLGSFFSICELERCRGEILGPVPDKERFDELSLFHCERFKDMSPTEAQTLVEKTAQYVGVEITTKRTSQVPAMMLALLGGMIIGAAGAWLIPAAKVFRSEVTTARVTHPVMLPEIAPLLPVADMPDIEREPVFNTTIRTDRPGSTARTLARTVRDHAGEYEVSLTVTPVTAAAD